MATEHEQGEHELIHGLLTTCATIQTAVDAHAAEVLRRLDLINGTQQDHEKRLQKVEVLKVIAFAALGAGLPSAAIGVAVMAIVLK